MLSEAAPSPHMTHFLMTLKLLEKKEKNRRRELW